MSPLSSLMLASVIVVVVGTILSCSYEIGDQLFSVKIDIMYLFGLAMALLATMSIALRNVMEEIIFADYKKIDPLLFSSCYGLFGTGLIGVLLCCAQFWPGPDKGVQATIPHAASYASNESRHAACNRAHVRSRDRILRRRQEDTVDSVRKLLTGGLHEAVALCLLLSIVFGGLGQTMHKSLTRRFGATATRLMSNLQAVVAWVFAIALFYTFRDNPLLGGIGEIRKLVPERNIMRFMRIGSSAMMLIQSLIVSEFLWLLPYPLIIVCVPFSQDCTELFLSLAWSQN